MQALNQEYFPEQSLVFSEGDEGSVAYLIEDGCVEILHEGRGGPRRLTILSKGSIFGELSLLDGRRRSATARALLPTRLVRIEPAPVRQLLAAADPVVRHFVEMLLGYARRSVAEEWGADHAATGQAHAERLDIRAAAMRALRLSSDLASAITLDQLYLAYQPLVDLRSHALVGMEALVRWQHPEFGSLSPAQFIPLAEKTGIVHDLGRWVFRRAIADWPTLKELCVREGAGKPSISVNLSAPELANAALPGQLAKAMQEVGMAPAELKIELTETSLCSDMTGVSALLCELQALGVGIALDDFGTGYAGLDYLQTLPFSCIKIDMSFVKKMSSSSRSHQIVQSALTLGRGMGMSTVAEGIETAEIAAELREMGCDIGQGYHLGRPMPLAAFIEWANGRVRGPCKAAAIGAVMPRAPAGAI